MTGGIHKILLVSLVCFCMTLAFPVEDNEKGKSTEAPAIATDPLAKAQDKEPRLEDQKNKDEAHPESSIISSDKQQQKEPLQKPSLDGDQHQKPEKPHSEQSQENKDQHSQHQEKPSEQTTLSSSHDHQKPQDQNDQLAVPTEEKKEEQKDIELRHLPSENSPIGSFSAKDTPLAAAKLENEKNDKDELHQEKKIEEAILASTGASEKKPEEKALPESTPESELKDEQKTTGEQQLMTESSSKPEAADGHSTAAPGASTTIAENLPHQENAASDQQKQEQKADLSHDASEQPVKETTEASQQQTTAGIQEQTSTSASLANTSNNPNL